MGIKVGSACGTCSRCGREIQRPRPVDVAICDCWEHCPQGHRMQPYTPDLTAQAYGSIGSAKAYGDSQHPMNILVWCPICQYFSTQKPVEVRLT